jgi:hypothetical protein
MVRDALQAFVPDFVSQLIWSGLSTDLDSRPPFDEIIKKSKWQSFRIADEVDSEAVSAFVSSVESSELEVKRNTPNRDCNSSLRSKRSAGSF